MDDEKAVLLLKQIQLQNDILIEIRDLLREQVGRQPTIGQMRMANCSHGDYTYSQNGSRICRKCGQ